MTSPKKLNVEKKMKENRERLNQQNNDFYKMQEVLASRYEKQTVELESQPTEAFSNEGTQEKETEGVTAEMIVAAGFTPYYIEEYGGNSRMENYVNGRYLLRSGDNYETIIIGDHFVDLPVDAREYPRQQNITKIKFEGSPKNLDDLLSVLRMCTKL